jgi:hypothetical protein
MKETTAQNFKHHLSAAPALLAKEAVPGEWDPSSTF